MNVVLDTNVLISAILWRQLPHDALRLVLEKHCLVQSPETIAEFKDVLNRKKFKAILDRNGIEPSAVIETLLTQCELYSISNATWRKVKTVSIDDPDNLVFIALAVESNSSALSLATTICCA